MALIDNLVSYYKLDETSGTTATDSHGSNNGTNNGAAIGETGIINTAYDFDGVDDYIDLGNSGDFNPGTGDFSVSAWVNLDTIQSGDVIIGKTNGGSASSSYGWGLFMHDFGGFTNIIPQFIFSTSSSHAQIAANDTAFSTGGWVHIVAVLDRDNSANCKIYVNGDSTGTTTSNIASNTGPITNSVNTVFGSESDFLGRSFIDGKIDEVGIWNSALTSDEVTELYNSGDGLAYPFVNPDFITTCNWTATGTYTMSAYRGSFSNVVTGYSLYYRKKGDSTWIETTDGTVNITSTGEWEIGNDWNKSGDNVLTHSYYSISAIDSCTDVYFNETDLGTTVGDYFLAFCWYNCSSLASMPSGFNLPTGITSVGNQFLAYCWRDCTSLASMPSGFNLPTGITSVGNQFLAFCWYNCSSLTSMPSGFNLPTGITSVGNYFLYVCWRDCTSLASMPSGFNLPTGITSVGSRFLYYCWYNCSSLTSDGYTEDIDFPYAASYTFGGTCPITPDSPSAGESVAVHRPGTVTGTNTQLQIGDSWKTIEAYQINILDDWKNVVGMQIVVPGDEWKTIY